MVASDASGDSPPTCRESPLASVLESPLGIPAPPRLSMRSRGRAAAGGENRLLAASPATWSRITSLRDASVRRMQQRIAAASNAAATAAMATQIAGSIGFPSSREVVLSSEPPIAPGGCPVVLGLELTLAAGGGAESGLDAGVGFGNS